MNALCSTCNSVVEFVDNGEGDYVCRQCGEVSRVAGTFAASYYSKYTGRSSGYQRRTHLSTTVRATLASGTEIHEDLYELLFYEARFGKFRLGDPLTASRNDYIALLVNVDIPWHLASREDMRLRRSNLPRMNLTLLRQKWRQIKMRMVRDWYGVYLWRPPGIPRELVDAVFLTFRQLEAGFLRVRHGDDCDRTRDCHKRCTCRYFALDYNYQIAQILRMLMPSYYGAGWQIEWDTINANLTHLVTRRCLEALDYKFEEICRAVGFKYPGPLVDFAMRCRTMTSTMTRAELAAWKECQADEWDLFCEEIEAELSCTSTQTHSQQPLRSAPSTSPARCSPATESAQTVSTPSPAGSVAV